MLKKFFSLTSPFNIMFILSLIFIIAGIKYQILEFTIFGVYIDMIPRIYNSFIDYNNTKKLTFSFVLYIFCFLALTAIFIYKLFSYLPKF